LYAAAVTGDKEAVEALLAAGAKPDSSINSSGTGKVSRTLAFLFLAHFLLGGFPLDVDILSIQTTFLILIVSRQNHGEGV
jgi:hypothetical protein